MRHLAGHAARPAGLIQLPQRSTTGTRDGMIDRSQADWYKDAVIYQLHIKAFFDANNDGIGDFAGLMQKLEYVQELGVNTVWLLPFYPSPLRDDGYDIADYRSVNPSFGTLRDVRTFVKAAHERGLRVITELVINHTSDQHPWFQRARLAKRGSAHRNYYVWSDSDQRYLGTRIIFIDTEPSNWTWDPVAQQYFWHRFYFHQPDLNFDNPSVLREILRVLHFWLEMGIDGLRLDAIPYLVEREGTINENLPETHAVLKRIRAEIDQHFPGRMLLAEANQWPEDVLPYFGDGDECNMAFHFPVMPRMYMAIAQEDRHPMADILRQTPDIPANCQWGIFLRNHDELTLEMVTDRERDYLWNVYAADKRMRLNLGIRRRLAPLMDNDLRKIQLMNSLLFSMPCTPLVYYGDEIGMGDNVYLGDRDGVRTPMQWSPDRNAGFSRADPARLYLPPIMDPIYGFDAVNVEAQQRDPSSLLNWMKRVITVRQQHPAFGRGTLRLLYPRNRKILAYLRERDGDKILCVANLARSAQAVELNLSEFRGHVPVEVLGRSPFPPIGDLPYLLTLPAYGFYWFVLAEEAVLPRWHEPVPEPLPDFITLVMRDGLSTLIEGPSGRQLARDVLPAFLANQRWFGAKDLQITATTVVNWAELASGRGRYLLAEIEVQFAGGAAAQRYFMPLATSYDDQALTHGWPLLSFALAQVRRGAKVGALYDAMAGPDFPLAAFEAIRAGSELPSPDGAIRFWKTSAANRVKVPENVEVKRLSVEQSNSSAVVGNRLVLKTYRKLSPGAHPDVEIGRFLIEKARFANTPPLLGAIERAGADGQRTALAAAFGFVRNQGDGWVYTVEYLQRTLDELRLVAAAEHPESAALAHEPHAFYLARARVLGQRTAELHRALATPTDDAAFATEPITRADLRTWQRAARHMAETAFKALKHAPPDLAGPARDHAQALLARRKGCYARIDELTETGISAVKTRIHGDYHLGQVLVAQNDFYILDFEGEPARPLAERRAKSSPLKDVAGMLRSFDYAAGAALVGLTEANPGSADVVRSLAEAWRRAAAQAFLDAYRETIGGCPSYPKSEVEAGRLLDFFLLDKALYEICYEAANRPAWIRIPLKGVINMLGLEAARDDQD
jgi:maltose alpha-D-glucosyltransferase / alpha-amylase